MVVSATQKLLRFGTFELNIEAEDLSKSGIPVKLPPQPLKLLALLASRAGQVVTRNEIQEQLWVGETFVDFEHGVNKCINQIRTALGDNADNPVYVETLPRRGYRFVAPVVSKTIPAPQPKVIESDSGERSRPPLLTGGRMDRTREVAEMEAASLPAIVPDAVTGATQASPTQKARSRWSLIRLVIGATVLLVTVVGGGLYWRYTHKAPVLTEKDTIVLADFDNKTGDPVFDDTLKQGLSVQLGQSRFLAMMSDSKVNQTLNMMGRPAGDRLTPEVTRQVCERTGSKAMLTGSISSLGSQYVIGLKAVNCDTGDLLAEAQEEAIGKEAVLKALDVAAVSIRRSLGESLGSVQKYATPLEETTTPSLEALEAYSRGRKIQDAKGDTSALPFFKRAVELDPNFAAAYAALSGSYFNLSEPSLAAENAREAYELREKATERERFAIEALYYMLVTGELEKVAHVYELWQQSYPRDYVAHINLSAIYSWLGSWEKALEEAREAMRLEPNDGMSYDNLGAVSTNLNRLDEAAAVYQQAQNHKLESEGLLLNRYQLAFLKGDSVRMAQMVSAAVGKPGTEDLLLAGQADTEAWYGKLKNARELTRRAMDSAERNDAKETAAAYQAAAALREMEFGNWEQARADADAALKLAPNRNVRVIAALALARAGDMAKAESLAVELDKTFPLDTLIQGYWLPTIRAAIALQKKDPNHAVELLRVSNSIELGQAAPGVAIFLCPAYLRGEAYLMLGDGTAAAAEFQKFVDHWGLVVNFPWGALARLDLARAYAMQGDTVKARVAYQSFLLLWKDADSDVPVYQQARAEYAKLH